MKQLFTVLLTMSFVIYAQDDVQYKYEPEANKAEYYIGTFNKGKDVEDLSAWYEKFAKWADTKDGIYDSMSVAILQPYFHSNLAGIDVMWVNTWPTPGEQFKGLETWITDGGAYLLKSLPVPVPPVVTVCAPEPLKVTVPDADVNVPLLDQFPATDIARLLPASNVVLPAIVRSLETTNAS